MAKIKKQKSPRLPKANPVNHFSPDSETKPLVSALLDWFAANARDLPWRRNLDPYAIWVSEIMLQQTQVKTVIPYWERWMRELPTVDSLAKASAEKIHKLWEGLGYYTRVRNMQKAAQLIVAEHNGSLPSQFDDVLGLPGVGRYTAGAICSIAFNQPTPILDGNVIRVLTRIHGIQTDPREKQTNARLWGLAASLVAQASKQTGTRNSCSHLNQSLMELGALVCTPRTPNCATCPVKKLCVANEKNLQDQLPNLGKRAAATERHLVAFVIEHDGNVLVRQRPAGVVNAHLWEFPNFELQSQDPTELRKIAKEIRIQIQGEKPLAIIKHSITRYRITLAAWRSSVENTSRSKVATALNAEWRNKGELSSLAFSSAHHKILRAISATQAFSIG